MERPQPYIGVSGVGSKEECFWVDDAAWGIDALGYFAMLGVQSTRVSQWDDVENSRGGHWHPVGEHITGVVPAYLGYSKAFVHTYFGKDPSPEFVADMLVDKILPRTEPWMRGIQLNLLPWMDRNYDQAIDFLQDPSFKDEMKPVVLQVHTDQLARFSPREIAVRLDETGARYALVDDSSGEGRVASTEALLPFVDALYEHTTAGVVVAGGLSGDNVQDIVGPLIARYGKTLSWDAEGRLRALGDHPTFTYLQRDKVSHYMQASLDLIR